MKYWRVVLTQPLINILDTDQVLPMPELSFQILILATVKHNFNYIYITFTGVTTYLFILTLTIYITFKDNIYKFQTKYKTDKKNCLTLNCNKKWT